MNKSREYKISVVLFVVAIVLFSVSLITGLIPGMIFSVDKMCGHLGWVFFGVGLLLMGKDKVYNVK